MVSTEIRNVISRLENVIKISEIHLQNCDTNILHTAGEIEKINDRLSGNKELTIDPVIGKRFNQLIGKFDRLRNAYIKDCKCKRVGPFIPEIES